MSNTSSLVGMRIRKARELKNLTQKKLAEMTGIHEVLLRRYEYGDRNPKDDQLQKIADALDVNINVLKEPKILISSDAIYTLFELDKFGVELKNENGRIYIGINDTYVNNHLLEWENKKNAYIKGYITKEEYERWKVLYNPYIEIKNGKIVKNNLNP